MSKTVAELGRVDILVSAGGGRALLKPGCWRLAIVSAGIRCDLALPLLPPPPRTGPLPSLHPTLPVTCSLSPQVNNASEQHVSSAGIEDVPPEQVERVMRTNVRGCVCLAVTTCYPPARAPQSAVLHPLRYNCCAAHS